MSIPSSADLSDFCLAALLRCHRSPQGAGWNSISPRASFADREELLLRWALSKEVEGIAKGVIENPRAIRSAIAFETQTNSGFISGAVDARATLLAQQLATDPTLFVCSEPMVSPLTRRNQVLAWVLHEAESLIISAIRRHKLGPEQEWIHTRLGLMEQSLRSPLLREVLRSPLGRKQPNASALRDCMKSMGALYRAAAQATLLYESVERLEEQALRALLSSTLVANLEDWQRLELSAALAAGDALAQVSGHPARWKGSIAGGSEVITVGPYRVKWQNALKKRSDEQLDPSELLARLAADALGAGIGLARADVSVVDARSSQDIGHLECKWFGSVDGANGAIAEAITQLVRYCRDSRPGSPDEAKLLLADSAVIVGNLAGFDESLDGAKPTGLADFSGLSQGRLRAWAQRIHGKAQSGQAAIAA